MTENELKRCREWFEAWWPEYIKQGGVAHFNITADKESGFAAWQHQQAKIDMLNFGIKSKDDAISALLKKLDNYDDNYMAETRKVAHQSALLAKAVEALEEITNEYAWDNGVTSFTIGKAKNALAAITKGDNDAK